MAEKLNGSRTIKIPDYGVINNVEKLDAMIHWGRSYVYSGVGLGSEGSLFCMNGSSSQPSSAIQIFIGYTGTPRKIRTFNWSSKTWSEWMDL